MKILIDLQGAQTASRNRGIGRYSLALAKSIIRNRKNHHVYVMLNGLLSDSVENIKSDLGQLLDEHKFVVLFRDSDIVDNDLCPVSREVLREKFINELNPDIVLLTSLFEGPFEPAVTSVGQIFSSACTAVILYDLIPYIDPEKYINWEPAKSWYYSKIDHIKRADLILAISKSAANEAIEYLGVNADRLSVISSASSDFFGKKNNFSYNKSKLKSEYGIRGDFILYTSAFDERKNFQGLIKAFAKISKKNRINIQLVLVCNIGKEDRDYLERLAITSGLASEDLVLTGFVSDETLRLLYSECYLFVFPSFHEGFGLPILEAMNCGAPVIGSNTSSIPEVIGLEDALFDPYSISSISEKINKFLIDKEFRSLIIDNSSIQSEKFSWDQTAKSAIIAFENKYNLLKEGNENKIHNAGYIDRLIAIDDFSKKSDFSLMQLAMAIANNEAEVDCTNAQAEFEHGIKWRIEGPFDSTYSLALLNRETAISIAEFGHSVKLHSPDYEVKDDYLDSHKNIAAMYDKSFIYEKGVFDVVSRNNYPPSVEGMNGDMNLLHHYAWEESGYPHEWINNFNKNLDGITCLANHVEKILIDNGVSIPLSTSGCGVDHWERIDSNGVYKIKAKKFRFLHVSSCFPRKGVDRLLDAYGKAFTEKDDVTLVIKTFENIHNDILKWLTERKNKNNNFPHVEIIFGDISDSELKALYKQCHVLVAPSCAEGFGLPMAEAFLTGLPVITTAWGGQLDFCNEENSWLVDFSFAKSQSHFEIFSSAWAEVDINALSVALLDAWNSSPADLKRKASAGRKLLLEKFKWKDTAFRAINAFKKWKIDGKEKIDPKIAWFTTWNTKCGIATYSEHLIRNFPEQSIEVFSPYSSEIEDINNDNCIRYGSHAEIIKTIDLLRFKNINTVVIQFNYGLYDFDYLSKFIDKLISNRVIVILVMHATGEFESNIKLLPALRKCHRILVHSIPDLNRLKKIGLIDNVALFPHGFLSQDLCESSKQSDEYPLISTYGFCLPHKGLKELIEAVFILKNRGVFVRLRMLNSEYPAEVSFKLVKELKSYITQLGLEGFIEFKSDFLPDDLSISLLSEADLIVFPYQVTGESASGAVRYGLAARKPIAVTPLSIFDDIGGAAFKFSGVSSNDIAEGIEDAIYNIKSNSQKAQEIKSSADKWRSQHDYPTIGNRFYNMCVALLRKHYVKKSILLQGSNPLIRTIVGKVQGRDIVTTGVSGNLMHGPYLSIPPGYYQVILSGLVVSDVSGLRVEIRADNGKRLIDSVLLTNVSDSSCIAKTYITLEESCEDLEVVVNVTADDVLKISGIEILSCDFYGTYYFSAANPRFASQAGVRSGCEVISTGKNGYLLFGPYIPLDKGDYDLIINGKLIEAENIESYVDVAINKGNYIIHEPLKLKPSDEGSLVKLKFTLKESCKDFEVRIWNAVNEKFILSDISIKKI